MGSKEKQQISGTFVIVGAVLFYGMILMAIVYSCYQLPAPLADDVDLALFSEGRAWKHMQMLDSFGIRLTGSVENENLTPDYLLDEINIIAKYANQDIDIEIDVQLESGSFWLEFIDPYVSCYQDIKNILVKLSPKNKPTNSSILVSAHYDSTLNGKGISDNAINIGVMMEVLRALSVHQPLDHTLVFNFNGAEETLLQASHGFITKHKWAQDVKLFINLDGAGGSEAALMFQTGPDHAWLARLYSEVAPNPYSNIVGQEIFQSGIIPSDTDFRIYRDFGRIPGIDIAYIGNGHIYHTDLDTVERIIPGSLQQSGENILELIKHLGVSDIVADPSEHAYDRAVFFTPLRLFSVSYSSTTASIFNFSVVLVTTFYLSFKKWLNIDTFITIALLVVMIIANVLFSLVIGGIVNIVSCMSWYPIPALVIPLFVFPIVAFMLFVQRVLIHRRYRKKGFSRYSVEKNTFVAGMVMLSIGVIVGDTLNIGSVYVYTNILAYVIVSRIISEAFQLKPKTRLVLYFIGLFPGSILYLETAFSLIRFLIPVLGRIGNYIPPELALGGIFSIAISFISMPVISIFHNISKKELKTIVAVFATIFLCTLIYSETVEPFTEDAPQRVYTSFIDYEYLDGTKGTSLNIHTLDYIRGKSITNQLKFPGEPIPNYCNNPEWYCDFPYLLPIGDFIDHNSMSHYEVGSLPDHLLRPSFTFQSEPYSETTRMIDFTFQTTERASLVVNTSLVKSWSFDTEIPDKEIVYFLMVSGKKETEWNFWIEAQGQELIRIDTSTYEVAVMVPEFQALADQGGPFSLGFFTSFYRQNLV
eukprot:TRINITY_DN9024_c0_g1_i1.p1 TRINITY_DN9024_c0_g1~~TRINITY_DN9024_c0_g1_i1.p1  ORF type:complete len:815 (-),score=140.93 TRINITY_DN9024_c0_g1_i1:37-2481(-)